MNLHAYDPRRLKIVVQNMPLWFKLFLSATGLVVSVRVASNVIHVLSHNFNNNFNNNFNQINQNHHGDNLLTFHGELNLVVEKLMLEAKLVELYQDLSIVYNNIYNDNRTYVDNRTYQDFSRIYNDFSEVYNDSRTYIDNRSYQEFSNVYNDFYRVYNDFSSVYNSLSNQYVDNEIIYNDLTRLNEEFLVQYTELKSFLTKSNQPLYADTSSTIHACLAVAVLPPLVEEDEVLDENSLLGGAPGASKYWDKFW